MTDEELFNQWKSEQYKDQSTEEKMEFVEHLHNFPKYFKQAFLAGLKAKTQWHDLSEDPNDLPSEEKRYLIYTEDFGIEIRDYYSDTKGFSCRPSKMVLAWCELSTFNKEWCEIPKE